MLLKKISDQVIPAAGRPELSLPIPDPDAVPEVADDLVSSAVDSADRIAQVGRTASDGFIHATSLIGRCPRRAVIEASYNLSFAQQYWGADKIVHAIGRAVENHVRDSFIKVTPGHNVYGVWVCQCGVAETVGTKPSEGVCELCRTPLDVYKEPVLLDARLSLIGSPDLTYLAGGTHALPVEIKSINKKDYDNLKHPFGDHVTQAGLYRHLYQVSGFKVHNLVKVVYVCKDYAFKGSPYKEFNISFSDAGTLGVKFALEKALDIQVHVNSGTFPDKIDECRTHETTTARKCHVCDICFNL